MDFENYRKYNKEKIIAKGVGLDMGIAELTAKIESLSEEDYNMVIMLVNRLAEKSELGELKKLSEDALVEQLSESIRKSDMGATKPAREVSKNMRDKYAV